MKKFIKAILIPVIIGGIVGLLIGPNIDYNSLIKPAFSPPSILFPIVWTILYILMGISYGILDNDNLITREIKNIYYIQLTFNALWPIIFFILKWRLISIIWIIILDILVIIMIIKMFKQKKIVGYLQIPYLIWILFATYLNLFIYILN